MSSCDGAASVVCLCVCLSVCVSVCKLFCGNRYYDAKNSSIATKLAHDGHPVGVHPCCAQGRGQGQRSRDTSAFVPIIKIASSRRQIAGLWPKLHKMVPRCTCIQGVLKVKVKGHMLGAVLCWHEKRFSSEGNGRIATKLARDGLQRAYRMCPVSRSRSKVNRFFSQANGSIATKLARDGLQASLHPGCAQR